MMSARQRKPLPSLVSVIQDEVTIGMAIAGAGILHGWIDRDPELLELANEPTELVSLIYAAMRRERSRDLCESKGGRS